MMGRPSLKRCLPCSSLAISFKDFGSADSTLSSRAEFFPQHTSLSLKRISKDVTSTSAACADRAVSAGRSCTRVSCSGYATCCPYTKQPTARHDATTHDAKNGNADPATRLWDAMSILPSAALPAHPICETASPAPAKPPQPQLHYLPD